MRTLVIEHVQLTRRRPLPSDISRWQELSIVGRGIQIIDFCPDLAITYVKWGSTNSAMTQAHCAPISFGCGRKHWDASSQGTTTELSEQGALAQLTGKTNSLRELWPVDSCSSQAA